MTTSAAIEIFDRSLLRERRNRAAAHLSEYAFLHEWTLRNILERLSLIKRGFPLALVVGARSPALMAPLKLAGGIETLVAGDLSLPMIRAAGQGFPALQLDEEFLPLGLETLDAAINILNLHTVNDLPGALLRMRQALKPDGLFIGAMLGGETLYELRHSLMQAEMALSGGVSPRVAPFADKQQMGALMQRAGFALPVVDSEIVTVSYQTPMNLMRELRFMAENNIIAGRSRTPASKGLMMEAARHYAEHYADADGRVNATFEIIFLIGWAPHESQPKPLRRGSAERSLEDALNMLAPPVKH